MAKIKYVAVIMLAIVGFSVVIAFAKSENPKDVKVETIKWMSFEQALLESEKSKKKIFIDVYTDWCGYCKKMDAETLNDPKIIQLVNKDFIAVKLNGESAKKLVFKGKEYSERELAVQLFKVTGYPTTVYLNENLDVLTSISSYLDTPILSKILTYFGEDIYLKKAFNEYEASQK